MLLDFYLYLKIAVFVYINLFCWNVSTSLNLSNREQHVSYFTDETADKNLKFWMQMCFDNFCSYLYIISVHICIYIIIHIFFWEIIIYVEFVNFPFRI